LPGSIVHARFSATASTRFVSSSPVSKNILLFFRPKSPAYPARLIPHEGRIAIVTNVGMGCGGRGSVVAQGVAGRIFHCAKVREHFAGAWTNGASTPRLKCGRQHMADPRIGRGRCGRQKRVVPAPVAGAKPAEVYEPNRASMHLNPPVTVARRIRRREERAISR
jgi:hypothetical protein